MTMLFFVGCSAEADVVFMLDSSTSVSEPNFQKLLRFVANLVQDTHVETGHFRVGVLSYNTDVYIHFQLTAYLNNKEALLEAILKIPYNYGSTNTADGLKVVRTQMFKVRHGDRPNVPNILVVITDGTPNINVRRTSQEVRKLREAGIHLLAVGIGVDGNEAVEDLDIVATIPTAHSSFTVPGYRQLQSIRHKLNREICDGEIKAIATYY